MSVGQVIIGSVVSCSVTTKEHCAVLSSSSLAVNVIVCVVPGLLIVTPTVGDWDTVISPAKEQLSLTVALLVKSANCTSQAASTLKSCAAGQVISGLVLSLTVTMKSQSVAFPAKSVAVKVIVEGPNGSVLFIAGL